MLWSPLLLRALWLCMLIIVLRAFGCQGLWAVAPLRLPLAAVISHQRVRTVHAPCAALCCAVQAMCQDLAVTGPKGTLRLGDFVIPHNEKQSEWAVTNVRGHAVSGYMGLVHVYARMCVCVCVCVCACRCACARVCIRVYGHARLPV